MYIKSIVLDGFKSYGNRVEVSGFDPEFNAITGLNGTGKSNILDSICFVLGITNLSNVRAGSLQELIYKHGQAGITKATVSITFDNRDKTQCPIGYENHNEITVTRQVVMGGKNKYLINGINVQNKRVSDLFCSVQLNVNNPHFLIMQGRITKVLNMKPPEILSMVEEAAGTRMYEAKKQAAQKTIEKKDAKLRELNDIIQEDIAPKLQKLQEERAQFQEYQKVVRELTALTRLNAAYRYVKAEESAAASAARVAEVTQEIDQKKEEIASKKDESKQIDQQVKEINKRLDEESGNTLKQLESELTALESAETAAAAARRGAAEARGGAARRRRQLEHSLQVDTQACSHKNSILQAASSTFSSLKSASESSAAALAAAQARFLAVSAGREGGGDSLQDQLMAAKQEASEASTLVSQSSMQKKHCEERLKALEKEYKNTAGRHDQDQKDIDRLQAQVDALQRELSSLDYSEERHASLKESCRGLQASIRQKRDAVDNLSARLQRCDFKYTDPEPNFDRKRVCGTVCRLMTVKDPVYCTAIETAAGGRLYNVVVDTEVTSKLILQRGRLEARTTLVPLNKIHAACIDDRTVRAAQEHGGGPDNVQLALDLVTYPAHCAPALRWVLGNTLVCKDLQTAKRVTYHPSVMKRCVTLDGDVFDPSGTLSGGARAKGGSILLQLQQLRELEASLSEAEEQYRRVSEELGQSQRLADKYTAAMQRYEMSSHELSVLKQRVASTAHAHLHADIAALRAQVTDLAAAISEQERTKVEAAARAKELEAKVKDIKGHREREFKKAQAELDAAKKEAEKHSEDWKRREQEFETLTLEVRELEAGVAAARAQLAELDEALATLQQQEHTAQAQHEEAQSAVKELQARIKQQKADMSRRSGEVTRLLQHKETLAKSCDELELGIKELQYKITELEGEASDCEKRIKALEAEHPWIPSEREYFGQAGGAFDFARGGAAAAARVAQLTARRDKLQRGLNHRAHTLLGKEEEQYQDVMRKKQIVEADRAKLVQVMAELDQKKRSTLLAACSQVNKSFASIFSTLLPGAQASLAPPPGLTVLDGLEVKVGFNNTWKESLGELSGGQRSLVALALVLAMLQFKPAPLYILDEVDAALDLSHTQNIGQMLKEHFTASQFIIVSLKDGMFNNANVLFRTRFVDGMSAVQRTVNRR